MEPFDEDVLEELRALAGLAIAHDQIEDATQEICRIAERTVGPADGASLTTISPSASTVLAASNAWAESLDEMQYVEHEGPCLDAARTGVVFRVRDFTREYRWPSYGPRAIAAGVASMVSLPMTVDAKVVGALNVYSRKVDAFGSTEVSIAQIIAAHAGLAVQVSMALYGHRELAEQLRIALQSREIIGQAKGIIMATVGCNADAAFQRLVEQSQFENRKLREVAAALVQRYEH